MRTKTFLITVFILSFQFLLLQSQTYRIKVMPDGGNRYGYADLSGNLVINPEFKNGYDFSEDGIAIVFDGQKTFNPGNLSNCRLINISGEEIANISDFDLYDDPWTGIISLYNGGILRVLNSEGFGALNSKGEIVVPLIYDKLTDFNDGYALGKRDKKYYVVKSTGEEKLIEGYKFTYIKHFSEGLAPIEVKGQKFGFIDTSGVMVIQPQYIGTGYFSAGYAWVRMDDEYIGFIDKNGEWLIENVFTSVRAFDPESGLAMVKKDGDWGYLDTQGSIHFFEATDKTYIFSEGIAIGKRNGKFGFINNKGEWVVEPIYNEVHHFSDGYARVEKDGKWGLVDKKGNLVIELSFKRMGDLILIK